jgi:hypothetical protein
MEDARELIASVREKAARLEAGVTLLYVKEERLFELPIFGEGAPSLEGAREYLQRLVREIAGEEWPVLVYEGDPVDRALLEAEREEAALLITDLEGKGRGELLRRSNAPLLFFESGGTHRCRKGLIVFDPAWSDDGCLPLVRNVLEADTWSAYLDYQVVSALGSDLSIDPVADTLATEIQLEAEVMEARKKSFLELCEREGIPGTFEVGEKGLVEDILSRADSEGAECLAFVVEDRETLFAEALEELVVRAGRDLLVCFRYA